MHPPNPKLRAAHDMIQTAPRVQPIEADGSSNRAGTIRLKSAGSAAFPPDIAVARRTRCVGAAAGLRFAVLADRRRNQRFKTK